MKTEDVNGVPNGAPHDKSGQAAPDASSITAGRTEKSTSLPKGFWAWTILFLGVSASLFQLYTGGFGIFSSMIQRSVHWMFMSVMAFLIYRSNKTSDRKTPSIPDIILALLSLVAGIYIFFNWENIVDRAGMPIERDIYFGIVMIIIVLEATRRVVGMTLAVTAFAFFIYAFVGPWMPGILKHNGYDLERVVSVMYTSTEGIFGIPMAVSSTYIILFVLFGSFLGKCGGGKFFIDFAFALTGRARGGPAKASVLSSALMGTMSGAAVANVVTTGTFTIPLMKRCGYTAVAAGAIEAVASTGGQIVPPIMGAAAFIMSELTEIPYFKIAVAAIIPAFLFFFSVYRMVDAQARKQNIKALSGKDLPQIGATMAWGGHLFVPLIALLGLLIWGYSPMKSVFWSIILIIVMGTLRKTTRVGPWKFVEALATGARNAVTIAVACAAAGIIVGIISLTGLGLKFSESLISLSGGNIFFALFFSMLAGLILGCGMPTTAAYVVLASLAAPVLITLGVPVLAAHLFCLYFGCISTITPPVALSSYAGAGLAQADPTRVGNTAFKFGLVAYVVPYMIVYSPSLLMQGDIASIIFNVATACLGIHAFTSGLQKYFRSECFWWEQVILVGAGFCLMFAGIVTDITGAVLIIGIWLVQNSRAKKQPQPAC